MKLPNSGQHLSLTRHPARFMRRFTSLRTPNARPFSLAALVYCLWFALLPALATEYTFEDLGEPFRVRELAFKFVTGNAERGFTAWNSYESQEKHALIGVNLTSGELIWVDLTRFGAAHIQTAQTPDGIIYIYAGSPGHFFKYNATQSKLTDLGMPASPASYTGGGTMGSDGKFYVGTFPQACLVRCDPATGKVDSLGRISPDRRQNYLLGAVAGSNDVVYCPVGLHHQELWAVNTLTGAKKQILPDEITFNQGMPAIWMGVDGQVYGRAGGTSFRCQPDRVELDKTAPAARPAPLRAGGNIVSGLDSSGQLVLTDAKNGNITRIPTSYEGNPRGIYSVGCERDGRIYGGTMFPATSFCYDTKTGQLTNLGRLTTSTIQVYDTLSHPLGLFLSSYMPASVDFYSPTKGTNQKGNRHHIVTVRGQERPVQLATGPDGMIYTGTFPAKGRLGGALVRIDPTNFTQQVWVNIVSNQSIASVVAIPETGELFCTTSIAGGSSAIATEKSACVFFWNCRKEEIAGTMQPIAGAKNYGAAVRARNGLVYGIAGNAYYAINPKTRKTVFAGELPVKSLRFPGLTDEPAGPNGLIYGVGDDAIFAIDPANHSARIVARHKSLSRTQGFYVTADETIYYGSLSHLMRCRLKP